MALQTFIYVICFLLIILLLFDLQKLFYDWFSRIKIGKVKDKLIWYHLLTKKGTSWLEHTPKIRVTDNNRLILIDMWKGNYSKTTIQHWQEAALILGLSESINIDGEEKTKEKILAYLNKNFTEDGQWRKKPVHVDSAILAYALIKLDFIDVDQYKAALDYTWNLIKEHIGEDGTVLYRKTMKNYRYVDTIGFICPFLVAYGEHYKKSECVTLAVKQITEFEKYGMLKANYIPCHAYEIEKKLPLGLYGWGRGLGWFAIGLIDSWKELPEDNRYKKELEHLVIKFSKEIGHFQQENGCWNWTVSRYESRADSSATATLGWFLLNAAHVTDHPKEYWLKGEKALNYLMKVTRRDGAIDFSQGDTKDIGVYSSLFNIMPFTQGFAIRSMNLYLSEERSAISESKNVS